MSGGNGNPPIREGYGVEWYKDGKKQWTDGPKMVLAFTPDGEAVLEKWREPIPIDELRIA